MIFTKKQKKKKIISFSVSLLHYPKRLNCDLKIVDTVAVTAAIFFLLRD